MIDVKRFDEITLLKVGTIKLGYDLKVIKDSCAYHNKYGVIDRISLYTNTIGGNQTLKIRLEFNDDGIITLADFYESDLSH